jgi:hypothetical protein
VLNGPGVLSEATGSKALVCAVKEGEVVASAHDGGDLAPLGLCWVDSSGIVGASVQEDYAATRCRLDGGKHALKVKTLGFGAEVGVCLDGEVNIGEDLVVVGPCWRGEVDGRRGFGEEFGEEEAAEVDCTSTGDGLERDGLWAIGLETGFATTRKLE